MKILSNLLYRQLSLLGFQYSSMIYVFGDSFAASRNPDNWVNFLNVEVTNLSNNGSSEYRIWKTFKQYQSKLTDKDICIFVHTSPYRIFLKDDVPISSRAVDTHTHCDLIFNDIYSKNEKQFINVLTTIWDDEYFDDTFTLYVKDLLTVPNSVHITFFPSKLVDSFHDIWSANKGTTNHMSQTGNRLTAERILKIIS